MVGLGETLEVKHFFVLFTGNKFIGFEKDCLGQSYKVNRLLAIAFTLLVVDGSQRREDNINLWTIISYTSTFCVHACAISSTVYFCLLLLFFISAYGFIYLNRSTNQAHVSL